MVAAHEMTKTISEHIYYPKHGPRKASALYRHNHHMLVRELKEPCWICGKRSKLETHHWFEHAIWNNVNPKHAWATLLEIDFYGFSRRMAKEPLVSPDDVRNLCVLCVDHHRHREMGIHDLTFPIWIAQRAVRNGEHITDISV